LRTMEKTEKEIGLIGFGNFGQFLVPYLKPYFQIHTYDPKSNSRIAKKFGVKFSSLKEVASKDIVILSVPVQNLEFVLKKIRGFVKPDALVLDVSSTKVKPVNLMKKYLPGGVDILATHPLFGPQSGKNGIEGLKIVLCPVKLNKSRLSRVKNFLSKKLKLKILVKSPQQHDKEMAYVQALSHFIGKAMNDMEIPESEQSTRTYEYLLGVKKVVGNDSRDLFLTLQKENVYAKGVRVKFIKALNKIEREL